MKTERQLTLVALRRDRPPALQALIDDCITGLQHRCGENFVPYAADQLHATLVGLENDAEGGVRRHRNLDGDERIAMDVEGFAAELRGGGLPVTIRFGGFDAHEVPFTSRGQRPYERGFSIQGTPGIAVLIGWPEHVDPANRFPDSLDALRRRARHFGIGHAYHRAPADRDNDLYLRLGTFRDPLSDGNRDAAEESLRAMLAARDPVHVSLGVDGLDVVAYDDPTLPPGSTRAVPLASADVSLAGIAELLRDPAESG